MALLVHAVAVADPAQARVVQAVLASLLSKEWGKTMSKESSKAALAKRKEQTRNSDSAKGLYRKVRSKFVKDESGKYGRVVTVAREKLIEKNGGKDPGPDVIAFHTEGGSHWGDKGDDKAIWSTKAQNTAESNMRRAGKKKSEIKKKLKLEY
jgi:hypothetical protein